MARTEGTKMSKLFAEKILDSIVDENGHCGDRALSSNQFWAIAPFLEEQEPEDAGSWSGTYKTIIFTSTDYVGRIGKYQVIINQYMHFYPRYTVVSVDKVYDDSEQDMLDRKIKLYKSFTWNYQEGQRVRNVKVKCLEAKFIDDTDYGERWMYQLTDGASLFVWFTGCRNIVEGDELVVSMTVKSLSEYKGTKQTVVTRGRVAA